MLRICRNCKVEYNGDPTSTLCPACVAEQKKNVIRARTCRECGTTFPGGPRAWYCPACRAERKRAQKRNYLAKGPGRLLGSIDHCTVCGGEYIVNSSRQRYCPACAPAAVQAVAREQSRAWYAVNGDPDQRRQIRQSHAAELICAVCGKAFKPKDASITCSKECSTALAKRHHAEYERTHRKQRNEQRLKRYHKRKEANNEQ